MNTRTRFLLARSFARPFIFRTERHSLFRHFECIYRIARCRVTSPTPPLFGLSLKVLIKKNPNIRGWVVNISVHGYIERGFVARFYVHFFRIFPPLPLAMARLFIVLFDLWCFVCVCVARLTSLSFHSSATISNMISSKIVLLCLIGTAVFVVVVVFFLIRAYEYFYRCHSQCYRPPFIFNICVPLGLSVILSYK